MAACLLDDYSIHAEYDRSVAVITGRAVAERTVGESARHSDGVLYTVPVEEVYRGRLPQALQVFSENSSGRLPMQLHERYLLFIYQGIDGLSIDNCGNSGPVSQKTDVVRAVKAPANPSRDSQKPNQPLEPSGTITLRWIEPASAGRSAPSR